jgi:hypothetical protein
MASLNCSTLPSCDLSVDVVQFVFFQQQESVHRTYYHLVEKPIEELPPLYLKDPF